MSNSKIVAFGESTSKNRSDEITYELAAIAVSPPSLDLVFDRRMMALGGTSHHMKSAMTIGNAIVWGIVVSRFADRMMAMMRRWPSDDDGDSVRTMRIPNSWIW
jgi:hypothetical protein